MSACGFEDGGPGCVIYDEKRVSCGVTVMPGCEGGTWICRRVEGMCEVGMCVCVWLWRVEALGIVVWWWRSLKAALEWRPLGVRRH